MKNITYVDFKNKVLIKDSAIDISKTNFDIIRIKGIYYLSLKSKNRK